MSENNAVIDLFTVAEHLKSLSAEDKAQFVTELAMACGLDVQDDGSDEEQLVIYTGLRLVCGETEDVFVPVFSDEQADEHE